MSVTSSPPGLDVGVNGLSQDLARASLAMARRFHAGGTMWCVSPAWPFHAHHVAVEFVHPVIVGKRALASLTVPPGADVVATLRASVRPGDMVVALAPADDAEVADAMRRGPAWGVETLWIGHGTRPKPGAADHVVWLDATAVLEASEEFVRIYHLLWELTHVCFEHPGLLKAEPECTDDVCITCSDEGRLAEVVSVAGDEAVVRTAEGIERIDVMLIAPPQTGDLVLVHAGSAIADVSD
ncbi:MAG: HypC/HybG/HupF family hydrogenase formation chaperone [Acidimicrobiales bacterium]